MSKKIKCMVNGETMYIPAWAVQWKDGLPYLNTEYHAMAKQFGTATLPIDRLQNGSFRTYTPDPRFFNADGTPKNDYS
jgi:hypothetical protein